MDSHHGNCSPWRLSFLKYIFVLLLHNIHKSWSWYRLHSVFTSDVIGVNDATFINGGLVQVYISAHQGRYTDIAIAWLTMGTLKRDVLHDVRRAIFFFFFTFSTSLKEYAYGQTIGYICSGMNKNCILNSNQIFYWHTKGLVRPVSHSENM